jgi:hypothetical protein
MSKPFNNSGMPTTDLQFMASGSGDHNVVAEPGDESEDTLDGREGLLVVSREPLPDEELSDVFDLWAALMLAGSKERFGMGCVVLPLAGRIGIKPGSTTPKVEEFMAPAPC